MSSVVKSAKKFGGSVAGGTLGAVGLGSAFGEVSGSKDLKKARKADEAANRLESKHAQLQLVRGRRKLANQARIQRAELLTSAVSSGGGRSSAFEGASASVGSDVAGRVGEAQEDVGFGSAIAAFRSSANQSRGRAGEKQATTSSVLSIGSSLAGL